MSTEDGEDSKHVHVYGTTEVLENKTGEKNKIALSCQMFVSVSLKISLQNPS